MTKIEVLRVLEGGLRILNGWREVDILPEEKPALLAALLVDAGAVQVSVRPDAQGYADLYPLPSNFPKYGDEDDPYVQCWLLPIPEDTP